MIYSDTKKRTQSKKVPERIPLLHLPVQALIQQKDVESKEAESERWERVGYKY